MENYRRQAEGTVYNFNAGGNSGYPNVQNMNMTAIQGQWQDQGQGQVLYGDNQVWYPVYIYPNLQPGYTYPTLNMIQGQGQGQHQDQGQLAPYGYNQAWYPGIGNNNLEVPLDYTYPNLNMDVNINMTQGQGQGQHQYQSQAPGGYNQALTQGQGQHRYQSQAPGGYNQALTQGQGQHRYQSQAPGGYNQALTQGQGQHRYQSQAPGGYNQALYPGAGNNNLQVQPNYTYPNAPPADSYYQLQPRPQRPQVVEQPQAQRVMNARRREHSRWHSNDLPPNELESSSRRNNNTLQPAGVANIGEGLMRMTMSDAESSTQLEGHAEPREQANAEFSDGRFFVIKSYCRRNVVSCINHGVWTSTRRGNRILNAAYSEARTTGNASACPVFLFFSVKGSRKFCGVAEMAGPVDFGASVNCWDRKWYGKFPVKWHIIKDVPYRQFRHITFNSAGNPNEVSIIYCRDAQQVELEEGKKMLNIFKNYVWSSLLDDVSTPTASSTASSPQQQSLPPSPPQQHQEQPEVEKQKEEKQPEEVEKEKEVKEAGRKKVSEQHCTMNASCDINSDKKQPETVEESPNKMQLQEIPNTDHTQQTQMDTDHAAVTSVDTNETAVDVEETTKESEDNSKIPSK